MERGAVYSNADLLTWGAANACRIGVDIVTSTDKPAVSVVVPSVGRPTRLFLTLSALCRQITSDQFEVIVVDDSADRRTIADVTDSLDRPLPLRTIHTGGLGAASARNAGARAARGQLLLFLDDDTVADDLVIERHILAHSRNEVTVAHGVVIDLTAFTSAAEPVPPARRLTGLRDRHLELEDLGNLPLAARRLGPRRSFIERTAQAVVADDRYESLRWLLCIGTNTSMPRALFEKVNGFDTHYDRRWGGEDLELGLRLMAAGAQFTSIDATAYHLPLARGDVSQVLPAFWRTVAERQGRPPLAMVGDFLCGDIPLETLAAHLRT